jgi:hypothetical protein
MDLGIALDRFGVTWGTILYLSSLLDTDTLQ